MLLKRGSQLQSEALTSYRMLNQIISRAMVDPAFRQRLLADPHTTLRGYPLTKDDSSTLAALSPEQLYRLVGERVLHQIVPVQASQRFTIIPAHCTPTPDQIALVPDATFGNGTHETTRLSLDALERHLRSGDEVLDLGTGSGMWCASGRIPCARWASTASM